MGSVAAAALLAGVELPWQPSIGPVRTGFGLLIAEARASGVSVTQVNRLYQEAVDLFRTGQYELAEARFRAVLQLAPDHQGSHRYLELIRQRIGPRAAPPRPTPAIELRRQLQETILPEIDLRESDLDGIVSFLRRETTGRAASTPVVNFLLDWPAGLAQPRFTFSMRRVSVLTLLHYLVDLGQLEARLDPQTVVIRPRARADGTPVPGSSMRAVQTSQGTIYLPPEFFEPAPEAPVVPALPAESAPAGPDPFATDPFATDVPPFAPDPGPAPAPVAPGPPPPSAVLEDPLDAMIPELPELDPTDAASAEGTAYRTLAAPPTERTPMNPRYLARLKAARLPVARFDEAQLVDVLRFITGAVDQHRGQADPGPAVTGINFVSTIGALPASPQVSLWLNDIPVFDLLVYLAENAPVELRVDEEAAVVQPNVTRSTPKELSSVLYREYPQQMRQQTRARLQEIVLPEIHFFPSDVEEVLQALRERCVALDQAPVNIVSELHETGPALMSPIRLGNVPLLHILAYLAENSAIDLRIDPHAVVCVPSTPRIPKSVVPQLSDRADLQRRQWLLAALRQLVIAEAVYDRAPLAEILEQLRQEADRQLAAQAGRTAKLNILLELDPMGVMPTVSLELRQVPLPQLLEYVAAAAKTKLRVDPYAVVFIQEPGAGR